MSLHFLIGLTINSKPAAFSRRDPLSLGGAKKLRMSFLTPPFFAFSLAAFASSSAACRLSTASCRRRRLWTVFPEVSVSHGVKLPLAVRHLPPVPYHLSLTTRRSSPDGSRSSAVGLPRPAMRRRRPGNQTTGEAGTQRTRPAGKRSGAADRRRQESRVKSQESRVKTKNKMGKRTKKQFFPPVVFGVPG